ncbi:recombinase [Burkholderia sp. LS-044]|uniref:plasmid recombination protein n=1 Tax=Burkholderia sp. LS-044 TaxID=1459967 RepID=UPI0010A67346|nr:plasmid recombination protein [Burkholderia sp. LS-044]THJ54919.1 recombinase [Burkholderia sp. LS-044]
MATYNILRTKRIKSRSNITQAARHNLRLRWQKNIDTNRSHLNRVYVNALDVDIKNASSLQEQLTDYYKNLGVKEKVNNVPMMEFVISASPAFFEGKSKKQIDEWANQQVEFMKHEFGDQVKFAILHLDEKTPHFHFMISTEIKSVKKYRNQKGDFHKETWSLNAKRYDREFLKALHDRHAIWNKKFGLVRGVRGSQKAHSELKEFYNMVDKAMNTNYEQTIERIINDLESGWFSGKVPFSEIRKKFKPMMNTLLKSNEALKKMFSHDLKLLGKRLYKQKKAQEEKQLDLERQEKELNARREAYAEAINSKGVDLNLIQAYDKKVSDLLDENEHLKAQNDALQALVTPKPTPSSQNTKKTSKNAI